MKWGPIFEDPAGLKPKSAVKTATARSAGRPPAAALATRRGPGRPPGPAKFDPERHCGAIRPSTGTRCKRPKGFGVPGREGVGPCKWHGGAGALASTKHGLYSKLNLKGRLAKKLKAIQQADVDLLDLSPEMELMRALVADYLERYNQYRDSALTYHRTVDGTLDRLLLAADSGDLDMVTAIAGDMRDAKAGKPLKIPDIADVTKILDRVGSLAARMHKIRTDTTITSEQLRNAFNGITEVLSKHLDKRTLKSVLRDIRKVDVR